MNVWGFPSSTFPSNPVPPSPPSTQAAYLVANSQFLAKYPSTPAHPSYKFLSGSGISGNLDGSQTFSKDSAALLSVGDDVVSYSPLVADSYDFTAGTNTIHLTSTAGNFDISNSAPLVSFGSTSTFSNKLSCSADLISLSDSSSVSCSTVSLHGSSTDLKITSDAKALTFPTSFGTLLACNSDNTLYSDMSLFTTGGDTQPVNTTKSIQWDTKLGFFDTQSGTSGTLTWMSSGSNPIVSVDNKSAGAWNTSICAKSDTLTMVDGEVQIGSPGFVTTYANAIKTQGYTLPDGSNLNSLPLTSDTPYLYTYATSITASGFTGRQGSLFNDSAANIVKVGTSTPLIHGITQTVGTPGFWTIPARSASPWGDVYYVSFTCTVTSTSLTPIVQFRIANASGGSSGWATASGNNTLSLSCLVVNFTTTQIDVEYSPSAVSQTIVFTNPTLKIFRICTTQ